MRFFNADMRQSIERYLIESTSTSRSLLIILATIPYMLMYLTMHGYALRSPEIRAGLRVDVVWALQAQLAFTLCVLVGQAVWLWPKRHEQRARPGVEFTVALLVGAIYTAFAIAVGLFAAGPILVLTGVLAVGLLVFEWRVMLLAAATCAFFFSGYDGLMLWFGAPYGPAITAGAFELGGEPKWWWTFWQATVLVVSLPVCVVMITLLFASQEAMHRRLRQLSIADDLTGLANRHHFMDRLQAELARQQRSGHPMSLVLLDADHFKRINDRYGHTKGDEVLSALAQDLSAGVRTPTDLVARLGGEEFAILLPDTVLADAQVVCQRVQQRLRARLFTSAQNATQSAIHSAAPEPFSVTVSMGVVQALGANAQQILRQADTNLYRAKSMGRNRIEYSIARFPLDARASA